MEDFISFSANQTEKIGYEFAGKLKPHDVVFLIGDLGSGKTTFVKGLAQGLGVASRIMSPTFVIAREHTTNDKNIKTLYHLDLYRLFSEKQAEKIDIKDFLDDPNGVVVIEWPETSQGLVDKKVWKITFEVKDELTRNLNISYE